MNPIYASKRLDLSGWYAYRQPPGFHAVWDGGANRQGNVTGLWCPITGNIIRRPSSFLDQLPTMPLVGTMEDYHFHVTSLPHVDVIAKAFGHTVPNKYVVSLTTGENTPVPFYAEAQEGEHLLSRCEVADFVACRILPNDDTESRRVFHEMGDMAMARHPMSMFSYAPTRNPYFAVNQKPVVVYGTVDHVTVTNGGVEAVQVRIGYGQQKRFAPIYWGDTDPDISVFNLGSVLTLFTLNDEVIGYE